MNLVLKHTNFGLAFFPFPSLVILQILKHIIKKYLKKQKMLSYLFWSYLSVVILQIWGILYREIEKKIISSDLANLDAHEEKRLSFFSFFILSVLIQFICSDLANFDGYNKNINKKNHILFYLFWSYFNKNMYL